MATTEEHEILRIGTSSSNLDNATNSSGSREEQSHVRSRKTNHQPHSASGAGEEDKKDDDTVIRSKIAAREDKSICRMKIALALCLVLSATAVALASYYITGNSLDKEVENKFYETATEILTVADRSARYIHNVLEDLAVTTTIQALHNNATWPYYTQKSFEQRISVIRETISAQFVTFSPMVLAAETTQWNEYSNRSTYWIFDSLKYYNKSVEPEYVHKFKIIVPAVHGKLENASHQKFVSPLWQTSAPPSDLSSINYNLLENDIYASCVHHIATSTRKYELVLSRVFKISDLFGSADSPNNQEIDQPESFVLGPVYDDFTSSSPIVGHFAVGICWIKYLKNLIEEGINGIFVVLSNSCGQQFTYRIDGPNVVYLGEGSLQGDYKYASARVSLSEVSPLGVDQRYLGENAAYCDYFVNVYAGQQFYDDHYDNSEPVLYLSVVLVIFVSTSLVFIVYDTLVTRRQNKVLGTAARTHQIVGSLFPDAVRDQILKEQEESDMEQLNKKKGSMFGEVSSKAGLRNFFSDNAIATNELMVGSYVDKSKPIADLFLNTTIMFADISGFTAWSSVREPSQVFTLLETVYHGFDQIARARRVFKVETVGDCYVAVAGLPDPRHDHAVVMIRFARNCLSHMNSLATKLNLTLGPGTEDLTIRVGLHSGPVTAGVLRGERARFQLFGDTMNTAARMETTGKPNKIHFSQETANLLIEANKGHWFEAREDIVVAKGKGVLQTYWLVLNEKTSKSSKSSVRNGSEIESDPSDMDLLADSSNKLHHEQATCVLYSLNARKQRLVEWNVELLLQLLKKVVARRVFGARKDLNIDENAVDEVENELDETPSCLKEIVEIIEMPRYKARSGKALPDLRSIDISESVKEQIREYVAEIASMYHDNPFHCFEHASHVTMSVSKLLGRIVAPDAVVDAAAEMENNNHIHKDLAAALHDHTYGITSDPLTQFAVVLSALIHDVDHRGVPNFVLAVEEPILAAKFNGKSVAEQNSVNLAWRLLMEPRFQQLRNCIYEDESELYRFRRLIVNSVMATDIFDKDLAALRKSRWNKAFYEDRTGDTEKQNVDRKATIVIEHLIQASDVAHTMQHWHVYQKWNALLFEEMYKAYIDGRTQKDPAESWYQGEIGFFDNYVIPLAKKLKDCGVFGVSSDEYLNYATENRREWEKKGMAVVEALVEKHQNLAMCRAINSEGCC